MAKRLPTPFKYRGKWRASVTMPDGKRPTAEFDKHEDAKAWIVQKLAEAADTAGHVAKLGGPATATLAEALTYYAEVWTVNKGGARAELNRINNYLQAAGMPELLVTKDGQGKKFVSVRPNKRGPSAFEAYTAKRRSLRAETYETIAALAQRKCSKISPADIREFMSIMSREGLSDSTIQKEIALLRHMFNEAHSSWGWSNFKNPCMGVKLGKSKARFVVLPREKVVALMNAAMECDNPLVPAAIGLALDSAMRKKSLLTLDWSRIDLENRALLDGSKTGEVALPLSQTTVAILKNLGPKPSGRVLALSDNALNMAWEGVRAKAGLPKLQFRDLRHVAATRLAKHGINAHQLQRVLGHKTITMALVYVNLAQTDMIEVLDKVAPLDPLLLAPPMSRSVDAEMKQRRSDRLVAAIRRKYQDSQPHETETPEQTFIESVIPAADITRKDSMSALEQPAPPASDEKPGQSANSAIAAEPRDRRVVRVDFRARRVGNG